MMGAGWLHGLRGALPVVIGVAATALASAAGGQDAGAAQGRDRAGGGAGRVPEFEPDPLWFEGLPNDWVTGAVGGVAVDSNDHVWVFQRPASIPDGEKAASLNPPQAECC